VTGVITFKVPCVPSPPRIVFPPPYPSSVANAKKAVFAKIAPSSDLLPLDIRPGCNLRPTPRMFVLLLHSVFS